MGLRIRSNTSLDPLSAQLVILKWPWPLSQQVGFSGKCGSFEMAPPSENHFLQAQMLIISLILFFSVFFCHYSSECMKIFGELQQPECVRINYSAQSGALV